MLKNVELEITEDDILILKVDLNQEHGLTHSRNSIMVATSGGNINLWRGSSLLPHRLNINVIKTIPPEERK